MKWKDLIGVKIDQVELSTQNMGRELKISTNAMELQIKVFVKI